VVIATLVLPSRVGAASPSLTIVDAISQALKSHPNIRIAKQQVRLNRGSVQIAEGGFDLNVQAGLEHQQSKSGGQGMQATAANPNPPYPVYDETSQNGQTAMDVSVSKLLPWGMTVGAGTKFSNSSYQRGVPGLGIDGSTTTPFLGSITFSITQPILRGFGAASTAGIDASKEDLAAAREDLEQSVFAQVRDVVSSYWFYVAAYAFLEASQASEDRALALLKDNQKLVKADLRPAAELRQLEASYSDAKRSRINSDQTVIEARYQLGANMGLDVREASKLGKPSTSIPVPPPPEALNLTQDNYVAMAYKLRRDLQASQRRIKAAQIRVDAAKNGLLPQLDLGGSFAYSGIGGSDDYFTKAVPIRQASFPGYTAMVNLKLQWPPQNNIANGILEQALAALRIAEESDRALSQQVGASVASAVNGLSNRAMIAHEGMYAAKVYEESVRNEEKKLKAGLSTLINLVLTRDRLTGAQASSISGLRDYAVALLNFRFVTGSLFESQATQGAINPARILEFPKEAQK